jgi:outer membrane protein assembly factor BamB
VLFASSSSLDIATSPALAADGTLYFSSYSGLTAVSARGSIKWTNADYGSSALSSPAISNNGQTIYVGSQYYDGLFAFYTSGSINWFFGTSGYVYSSPALGSNGNIYFGCNDNNFYAVSSLGYILWSFDTESSITSSAAVDSSGDIYVGTTGGKIYSFTSSGSVNWYLLLTASFQYSSPAIGSNGQIYIGSAGSDHGLYAISSIGSVQWIYVTHDVIYSSPSIGPDGNIVVGGYDNYVYSLSPSGTLRWLYKTGGSISTSPVIGADGKIYVAAEYLYAFYPSGSLQWISYVNYPETPVISVDGIIYVGTGSNVYAIGTLLSTQSPSIMTYDYQPLSPAPKFRTNSLNTVNKSYNHKVINFILCF